MNELNCQAKTVNSGGGDSFWYVPSVRTLWYLSNLTIESDVAKKSSFKLKASPIKSILLTET